MIEKQSCSIIMFYFFCVYDITSRQLEEDCAIVISIGTHLGIIQIYALTSEGASSATGITSPDAKSNGKL